MTRLFLHSICIWVLPAGGRLLACDRVGDESAGTLKHEKAKVNAILSSGKIFLKLIRKVRKREKNGEKQSK